MPHRKAGGLGPEAGAAAQEVSLISGSVQLISSYDLFSLIYCLHCILFASFHLDSGWEGIFLIHAWFCWCNQACDNVHEMVFLFLFLVGN